MIHTKTLHCTHCSHRREVEDHYPAYLEKNGETTPLHLYTAEQDLEERGTSLIEASRDGRLLQVDEVICPHCGHLSRRYKLDYRLTLGQLCTLTLGSCAGALASAFSVTWLLPSAAAFFAPVAGFLGALIVTLFVFSRWKREERGLAQEFSRRQKLLDRNACGHCRRTRLLELDRARRSGEAVQCPECEEGCLVIDQ